MAEGKLPLCAEMCSTKSLLAGDSDVIAQIYKERVSRRGYGSGAWGWQTAYREFDRNVMLLGGAASAAPPVHLEKHLKAGGKRMAKLVAHMRMVAGVLALAFIIAISAPVSAQQPNMVNPTADAVKEQQLLQQLNTI